MIDEVNEGFTRVWNRAKVTLIEYIAVIIASVAAVISLLSTFVTFMCIAMLYAQHNEVKELTDEVEVWQIYAAQLHVQLEALGFKPPELPEE